MRHFWNCFELYVANVSLALLVVMLTLQATARYVFQTGIPWTEEISRFAFIFFVYISASLAVFRATHIKVDVVLGLLPPHIRSKVVFAGNIIQICFFLTAAYAGMSLIIDMVEFPVYSPSLLLPLYYIYAVIPLAYFLMAVRLVQRMMRPVS